jgi:two-component system, OmpR family, sensor kinase
MLVQRVLEFSRVQQRRHYEFEPADLGALVRETVDAFAHGLSTQGFSFEVQQEPGPTIVQADPAALEQVLANLLDNAVKYSGENKAIVVRVRPRGAMVMVEVIDRGVGIAASDRAHIFDRFYRTPGTRRAGFGLGLAIVKELIRAHGGRVEVESALGAGSTFRVSLPLAAAVNTVSSARAQVSPRRARS